MQMSMDEYVAHLKDINKVHGKVYCINLLVMTQGLYLPDAVVFYDIYVRG
tara:strand:- start:1409 stop:1558 length:150 start_codon:yes stop_codon:yes gene_type:complete